ncbi:MAG: TIGR02206 family membrane protein, partial [Anaerolineales bacterium]|nr:TIGR02206 family membrane protein [Anaerolineales bacterium]
SYRIYEFAYFIGIGGALQSLLTPDAGIYGFPHYRFLQTFISHGLIIIAAIYMTLAEDMRPTWKSMLRVFVFTNLYMLVVYGINTLIGSNYLYVNAKPLTASVLDMLPDWPVYILYMEGIGLMTVLILYLPFMIKDGISKRRMKIAGKDRLDELLS